MGAATQGWDGSRVGQLGALPRAGIGRAVGAVGSHAGRFRFLRPAGDLGLANMSGLAGHPFHHELLHLDVGEAMRLKVALRCTRRDVPVP